MSNSIFIYDHMQKKVVPYGEHSGHKKPIEAAFQLITDEIDPIKNPVTREFVTSKSNLRRFYKERGYEEVGNEIPHESSNLQDHLGELKERGEW